MEFSRITAVWLDNASPQNEDKFIILIALENNKIIEGRWFGEHKQAQNTYPFILDKAASEFNFGSFDTEIWHTNLGEKKIQPNELFTVWIDDKEYIYRIETTYKY